MLWEAITKDKTSASWPSPLVAGGVFLEDMAPTFDQAGDAFAPKNGLFGKSYRTKGTHQVGVHGKAQFIPTPGTGFTGVFESGCDHAIIRLSSALTR